MNRGNGELWRPPTKVLGAGWVPHVRPSVHGPKTDSSNAFTQLATMIALGSALLPRYLERWGTPSRDESFGFSQGNFLGQKPCNFYDLSASSDDFLLSCTSSANTTVTVTEIFTCALELIIDYSTGWDET